MDEIFEPIQRYIINVGDFVVGETVYHDRCLSASFGGVGVLSAEIPWADSGYKPWDYRAGSELVDETVTTVNSETGEEITKTVSVNRYTGEFVLDPIVLPEPEPIITPEQRIAELEAENAELQDALLEIGSIIAEQDEHNVMLEDAILELAEIMGGI